MRGLLSDHRVGAGGGSGAPRTAGSEGAHAPYDLESDQRVVLTKALLPPIFVDPLKGGPKQDGSEPTQRGSTFRFHIEVGNRRVLDVEACRMA